MPCCCFVKFINWIRSKCENNFKSTSNELWANSSQQDFFTPAWLLSPHAHKLKFLMRFTGETPSSTETPKYKVFRIKNTDWKKYIVHMTDATCRFSSAFILTIPIGFEDIARNLGRSPRELIPKQGLKMRKPGNRSLKRSLKILSIFLWPVFLLLNLCSRRLSQVCRISSTKIKRT